MSNTVGPVCHIPPPSTPGAPQPLSTPGIPGPATDLNSVIALVNALRVVVAQMMDQIKTNRGTINNFYTQPDGKSDWVEVNRVTEKVRIYQNNDKTSPNYVDVDRINSLTMAHRSTGQRWQWKRRR